MTATSSMPRLWLAALCLLAAVPVTEAADEPGAEVELTWKAYVYDGRLITRQDQLEGIRRTFSPFKAGRGPSLDPMTVCGMDLELPSMLTLPMHSGYDFGGWYMMMTNAQAIRQFQFDPSLHTGWITLADVQPPQVTTEYHHVVIRLLRNYDAWKSEADERLLESLKGPGDAGYFAVIEWEMGRAGR